jgi:hypothetical protein
VKESFVAFLQDPASGEPLELVPFETGSDALGDPTIVEGLLYAEAILYVPAR